MALNSERSKPEASARASVALECIVSMTDQNQSHPTQARRRRCKSPANLSTAQQLPLPRLLDHVNAADGPSDDEEEERMRNVRDQHLYSQIYF